MEALMANITATCPLPFSGTTGQLFARALLAVVASHCAIFDDYTWPKDYSSEILNSKPRTFDFVIVGAGSAGSALAGRLADHNPDWSVLLIEAGDNPSLNSEIPALLFLNQDIDWKYETHAQEACLGFKNEQCMWSRGKAMGGSSSMNAMLYIRGHPKDYEHWKQLGNRGWGYDDLLPYFRNIEKSLDISEKPTEEDLYKILTQAYEAAEIPSNAIDNNEGLIGTRITKLLTSNGKRLNTGKYYLKETKNLFVMKNSMVQKVILDSNSNVAIGVEVRHKSGDLIHINVNKEVVLSAGSVATPHILMLSGIGPKTHLNDKGIECLHDLPVGKNLQDHLIFPLILKTNQHTQLSKDVVITFLLEYMLTKTGPLSKIGLTDYMAFIDTSNTTDYPDIQFHHFYFNKNDKLMLRPYLEACGYKEEIIVKIERLNEDSDLLGIYPTLIHPRSKGEILLSDSDLQARPKIKTHYFKEHEDMKTLLQSINYVQKLEKTDQFKMLGMELDTLKLSGCADLTEFTDDYWECYIRHMATTIYHPIGSAKMGPNNDGTSVVDNNLLVHGIMNLRVVDASIMPTIPGGNTLAATLVIAEKASDIIKNAYSDIRKDEL